MSYVKDVPDGPETGYSRTAQNERRKQEVLGATHKIEATRPVRSIGDMQANREAEVAREHTTTTFPSMGEQVVNEIDNRSATEAARNELLIQRHIPGQLCVECGHPAVMHDPRNELVVTPVHAPQFRTPGVTTGTHLYDENDPMSPNRRARSEPGQFMLDAMAPDDYAEAEAQWHRATRRHRADPDHPSNQIEL